LRLRDNRFMRDLHRCADPDRGAIEMAEPPPSVAEQFETDSVASSKRTSA
jgi:hypothetical protein